MRILMSSSAVLSSSQLRRSGCAAWIRLGGMLQRVVVPSLSIIENGLTFMQALLHESKVIAQM